MAGLTKEQRAAKAAEDAAKAKEQRAAKAAEDAAKAKEQRAAKAADAPDEVLMEKGGVTTEVRNNESVEIMQAAGWTLVE